MASVCALWTIRMAPPVAQKPPSTMLLEASRRSSHDYFFVFFFPWGYLDLISHVVSLSSEPGLTRVYFTYF